jgi:hypothetical protein
MHKTCTFEQCALRDVRTVSYVNSKTFLLYDVVSEVHLNVCPKFMLLILQTRTSRQFPPFLALVKVCVCVCVCVCVNVSE